jgi:hexulose-6-phosphate isomerase
LLGAERVVIPFVDASRIETDRELDSVVEIIERLLPVADELGIEVHLETALTPDRLASLVARLPSSLVKITYDVGNSASLGYHPDEEFAAYGARVGSVHIKDRLVGGGTVPLGTGDADFDAVFRCLAAVAYSGDFVLQVARGTPGNEVALARSNKAFVVAQLAGVV